MFGLTPAFVLVALAVSAAAGPVPGRQAPFAVAKRDDGYDALVDVDLFSDDRSDAPLLDIDVNNSDAARRLNSRLFSKRASYYESPEGRLYVVDDPPPLLDVGVLSEGGLLDLGVNLRRQTTGDVISPDPAGQSDADGAADVLREARTMRARAFRATVNRQKAKAKGVAHKTKTVTTTSPAKVNAIVTQQQPPVVAQAAGESTETATTLVPVDTGDRGSLLDLDLGLGHQHEAAAYSPAAVAAVAPASAVAAAAPVSTSSTGSKASNDGLVFDPNAINTKFAEPGAKVKAVKAVAGQDAPSVTDAAAPAATTLYTATNGNPTNGSLLDVDLDL